MVTQISESLIKYWNKAMFIQKRGIIENVLNKIIKISNNYSLAHNWEGKIIKVKIGQLKATRNIGGEITE